MSGHEARDAWLAQARGRWEAAWVGDLPPERLRCEDAPDERARIDADDRAAVRALLAEHEAAGRTILRDERGELPPLYRLAAASAADDGLTLRLGRTDYGEYLFTNVAHPERRDARGDASMADALAVCAVLVTADGEVPYGPRSARIADTRAGKRYHVLPSGHPEPPHDPVDGLYAELQEEAGVTRAEVTRTRLTGLVRALPSGKPELTFVLHTSATAETLRARRAAGVAGAWEFDGLEFFRWDADGARAWLEAHAEDAVAPGHAAVALAARACFPAP